MIDIKPDEISAILRQQLSNFNTSAELEEVGTVLQVGDGIARIYGLNKVKSGELVEFETGVKAIALNLEEDNVGVVLMGSGAGVKEGSKVKRTGMIASIKAGMGLVGRVINTLGEPIDGKGPIAGDLYEMPLERKAPGVIFREPVKEPLQTGLKAIDAMIPIGRGQRELIIGDRQTKKETHKHTNKRTNERTNTQTNKQTNKQANRQTNEQTNKQTTNQTNLSCTL